MKTLSKIIATCFGLGYFPAAPGTLTSIVVVLVYKFFLYKISWPAHLLIFLILFLIGIPSSSRLASESKSRDPRKIVIDEASGQYLALFQLSPTWFSLLLSFFLFRFFDIIKPFPIRRVENFAKGWGIMCDDVVAALYTGILVSLYYLLK
jgi:phosphatidylglycerophosphatase A